MAKKIIIVGGEARMQTHLSNQVPEGRGVDILGIKRGDSESGFLVKIIPWGKKTPRWIDLGYLCAA